MIAKSLSSVLPFHLAFGRQVERQPPNFFLALKQCVLLGLNCFFFANEEEVLLFIYHHLVLIVADPLACVYCKYKGDRKRDRRERERQGESMFAKYPVASEFYFPLLLQFLCVLSWERLLKKCLDFILPWSNSFVRSIFWNNNCRSNCKCLLCRFSFLRKHKNVILIFLFIETNFLRSRIMGKD